MRRWVQTSGICTAEDLHSLAATVPHLRAEGCHGDADCLFESVSGRCSLKVTHPAGPKDATGTNLGTYLIVSVEIGMMPCVSLPLFECQIEQCLVICHSTMRKNYIHLQVTQNRYTCS